MRLHNYFDRARPDLKQEGRNLIDAAFTESKMPRGAAASLTELSDRFARDLLAQLVDEGFLSSDTVKGAVHVAFRVKALRWIFPNLFPEGSLDVALLPGAEIRKGAQRRQRLRRS